MNKKRKLLWLLYPTYLAIVIIALVAVAWYATSSLKDLYLKKTAEDLRARSALVATLVGEQLTTENWVQLDALAKEMGQETFDAFLRDYYQDHTWEIGTGQSFRETAEEHCACDLGPLFEEWVYP